ncbi:MAG: hypothetical protein JWM58_199 [Rhizobium sp.]|nr:hypothetical protein [Rhizobium sp.]
MTVRYERPVSHSAFYARRLALLAFVMFVMAWGLHRFGPLETPSFLAVALASVVLAVVALYLAVLGLVMLWSKGARGGKASALALVLVILPLSPLVLVTPAYMNLPQIYDVSSDLIDPPKWIDVVNADQSWLGARAAPGANDREAQMIAYRGVTGRRYEGALDRVYTAARKVAIASGIEISAERGAPEGALGEFQAIDPKATDDAVPDALDNVPVPLPRPDFEEMPDAQMPIGDASIQGVHRTLIFGFRQDVVIRLREEAETTLVDIRVATRYGSHDLGSGAAFIESYLRALDAELLGIAGD